MNATKKLAAAALLLIAASAFSITELAKIRIASVPTSSDQNAGLTLYFGSACPHCKIVEEYLAKNDPENKLSVVQKEVWNNQTNANEYIEKTKICEIFDGNLSVPVLWDAKNQNCYSGDQPIINFLKQQTK
jgi:glutaredoxin